MAIEDSHTNTLILGAFAVHKPANTFHKYGMKVYAGEKKPNKPRNKQTVTKIDTCAW